MAPEPPDPVAGRPIGGDPIGDDPAALRDLAVAVARQAGDALAAGIDDTWTVDTKSTSTDMVTEMDRRSEELLVDAIGRARPDDAILGEEGTETEGTTGLRWVIDPLDGTTNYLYGLPGWNVSVGVERDGVPIAGAVVVPGIDATFAAALGCGATCNGAPMVLGAPNPLATSLVGTGFAYVPAVRHRQAAAVARLICHIRDVRRSGAAAADLCSVAAGRLDAYYESGLAHWDWSAGTIIAREAGARVERFDDHPLPGDLVVAAHPERFDELMALLRSVAILGSE